MKTIIQHTIGRGPKTVWYDEIKDDIIYNSYPIQKPLKTK